MDTVVAQRKIRKRCSTKERQLGLNPEGGAERVLQKITCSSHSHPFTTRSYPHTHPQEVTAMAGHIPGVAKIPKYPLTLGLWISRGVHRVVTALWVNTCSQWDAGEDNQTTQLGRNISPGQGFSFWKIAELYKLWASLVAQLVKNPPAMQETWVWSLGWEDPLGEGKDYPLRYSGLENSMDCIVHGVAKSQTRLSNFHFLHFHTNCKAVSKLPNGVFWDSYSGNYSGLHIHTHTHTHRGFPFLTQWFSYNLTLKGITWSPKIYVWRGSSEHKCIKW